MKKLSIAFVLIAAGVTFANAQTKDAPKKVAVETTKVAELRADTSNVSTKADVVRAEEVQLQQQQVAVDTMPVKQEEARRDPAVEQQKAAIKKEEARKMETKRK